MNAVGRGAGLVLRSWRTVRRVRVPVCRGLAWSVVMFKRMICVMALGAAWLVPSPASAQMT